MTPPIYQCSSGHTFCVNCKDNLLLMAEPRCPTCREVNLVPGRNRYAERDMSTKNLSIKCRDCEESIPFDKFLAHEPLCKPKIFQCHRCGKSGLTIEEYIECMESHLPAHPASNVRTISFEPHIVRGDRFGIRNGRLEAYDLMSFNEFKVALNRCSYTAPNSGCDDSSSYALWQRTDDAKNGVGAPYGNTFTFDLQAAQHPATSPSVQFGMNNGVMILVKNLDSRGDARYPPVLLRFFLYRQKGGINKLAVSVKILGSHSEIQRLKRIDHLCLCIKLGSVFSGPYASDTVENVRISGENLFKPEMIYPLRGFQHKSPDQLGPTPSDGNGTTRNLEYLEVLFRTQSYNEVYLNAGVSDAD